MSQCIIFNIFLKVATTLCDKPSVLQQLRKFFFITTLLYDYLTVMLMQYLHPTYPINRNTGWEVERPGRILQVTLWAGRAQCSSRGAGANWYYAAPMMLWAATLDTEWWRQTQRETQRYCIYLLYSCRILQGLERALSSSHLFPPQEIQSRRSFFQRTAISWGHKIKIKSTVK